MGEGYYRRRVRRDSELLGRGTEDLGPLDSVRGKTSAKAKPPRESGGSQFP